MIDRLTLLLQELARAIRLDGPQIMAAQLVIGSILLYGLAANLAWYYRAFPTSRVSNGINRVAASPLVRFLYELFRLAYYLVLPFAALLFGLISLRTLGLAYLDWADGIRWAIVLALATWSLLMFVWVPSLRATAGQARTSSELTWSRRLIEVIYMQAHWALYRAVCISVLTGTLSDELAVYWGTCLGLVLVAIEAWSDPRVRRHIATLGEGEFTLWSASQAIINAVGFVLTHNLWLLALLHFILEFSVPHLRPAPRPAPAHAPRPAPPQGAKQDTGA